MINYALILSVNYPTAQWTLDGDLYDGLTWLLDIPKPTQAELDALWDATQAQVAAKEQAAIDVKQSALNKLTAIGLTPDEIKSLLGV
jgi:acetaldehyde dehydrogenase (acetylating)